MPWTSLSDEARQTILGAAWAILWASVGRMLLHVNLVRMGKRKRFFSVQIIFELGVAIGMGIVAGGMADWLGLKGMTQAGFIAAASYLWPHTIEVAQAWMSKRVGIDDAAEEK